MASRDVVGGYPEGTGSEEAHRHLPYLSLPGTAGRARAYSSNAWLVRERRLQIAGLAAILLILAISLVLRTRDFQVFADGDVTSVSSRSASEASVVANAGIDLWPGDRVEVTSGNSLVVHRAREVTLFVDGRSFSVRTQASTIAELLLDTRVSLGPQDSIRRDGVPVSTAATLAQNEVTAIDVRRAVPVTIVENGLELQARSSGDTIAAVLEEMDVRLGPGDSVRPPLTASLSAGMQVRIEHARQMVVTLPEGKTVLYTLSEEVGPALAASGILLPNEYRLEPTENTPISAGLAVRVVGISRDQELEAVRIESQTLYQPDPSLPAGTTRTTFGQDGLLHREYAIQYEDDVLVSRSLSAEWYDPVPIDTVIYYSTAPALTSSSLAWADLVCAYNWDCDWALAVIQCESAGNPNAYNPAGYVGLFQIWEGHGFNLRDPATNVAAAYSLSVSGGRGRWPNCP